MILEVANSSLILNVAGGPTDDKPTVTLTTPQDSNRTSAFLTPPEDRGREIRAYVRDPDGHLIGVGQSTGIVGRGT